MPFFNLLQADGPFFLSSTKSKRDGLKRQKIENSNYKNPNCEDSESVSMS